MCRIACLFCLLLLTCTAYAQTADKDEFTTKEKLDVQTGHDRFEGVLTVLVGPILLKDASETDRIAMVIASVADEKPPIRYTSPSFRFVVSSRDGNPTLRIIFLADEERVEFPETSLVKRDVLAGGVLEMWDVTTSLDLLNKLAKAKKVEGRVGTSEFTMKDEQIKALRAFVSHL
jgi:hypothetical protein